MFSWICQAVDHHQLNTLTLRYKYYAIELQVPFLEGDLLEGEEQVQPRRFLPPQKPPHSETHLLHHPTIHGSTSAQASPHEGGGGATRYRAQKSRQGLGAVRHSEVQ